ERMNVGDLPFHLARGVPQINVALKVEPELGRRTEQFGQPQGHLRAQRAPLAQELIHGLSRDTDGFGQSRGCQSVFIEELFSENLARMDRATLKRTGIR